MAFEAFDKFHAQLTQWGISLTFIDACGKQHALWFLTMLCKVEPIGKPRLRTQHKRPLDCIQLDRLSGWVGFVKQHDVNTSRVEA